MANNQSRQQIAKETVQICEEGSYTAPSGKTIKIGTALERARQETRLFDPDELEDLTVRWTFGEQPDGVPSISVTNETTLVAAQRLHRQSTKQPPMALNFASAKNPGGGFLNGASAQEESLCRKSGLYPCLQEVPDYYERNRSYGSSLYTDHMIFSPNVPVIRDEEDRLLDEPYLCNFITAPAVNAGAVRENEPKRANMIQPLMEQRIEKLIALCVYLEQKQLILGAWGCGVFRNDPEQIARWFGNYLGSESPYSHLIDHVVFAVLDGTSDERIITPFREQFT